MPKTGTTVETPEQNPTEFEQIVVRIGKPLADKIDEVRGRLSINQFIRYAIGAKLRKQKIDFEHNWLLAPSRKGKGGPKRKSSS